MNPTSERPLPEELRSDAAVGVALACSESCSEGEPRTEPVFVEFAYLPARIVLNAEPERAGEDPDERLRRLLLPEEIRAELRGLPGLNLSAPVVRSPDGAAVPVRFSAAGGRSAGESLGRVATLLLDRMRKSFGSEPAHAFAAGRDARWTGLLPELIAEARSGIGGRTVPVPPGDAPADPGAGGTRRESGARP